MVKSYCLATIIVLLCFCMVATKESGGSVNVSYTIINTAEVRVGVLRWLTPLHRLTPMNIEVKFEGESLPFSGFVGHRKWHPTPNDYVYLEPGECTTVSWDLADHFDMSQPGIYSVTILPSHQHRAQRAQFDPQPEDIFLHGAPKPVFFEDSAVDIFSSLSLDLPSPCLKQESSSTNQLPSFGFVQPISLEITIHEDNIPHPHLFHDKTEFFREEGEGGFSKSGTLEANTESKKPNFHGFPDYKTIQKVNASHYGAYEYAVKANGIVDTPLFDELLKSFFDSQGSKQVTKIVKDNLATAQKRLEQVKMDYYYFEADGCSTACPDKSTFAEIPLIKNVYAEYVCVCSAFLDDVLDTMGQEGLATTLYHEFFHIFFNFYDYAYDEISCRNFAKLKPDVAIKNPNNYAWFVSYIPSEVEISFINGYPCARKNPLLFFDAGMVCAEPPPRKISRFICTGRFPHCFSLQDIESGLYLDRGISALVDYAATKKPRAWSFLFAGNGAYSLSDGAWACFNSDNKRVGPKLTSDPWGCYFQVKINGRTGSVSSGISGFKKENMTVLTNLDLFCKPNTPATNFTLLGRKDKSVLRALDKFVGYETHWIGVDDAVLKDLAETISIQNHGSDVIRIQFVDNTEYFVCIEEKDGRAVRRKLKSELDFYCYLQLSYWDVHPQDLGELPYDDAALFEKIRILEEQRLAQLPNETLKEFQDEVVLRDSEKQANLLSY